MQDLTQLWNEIVANRTLVWLFTFFVLFVGFALRPGSRKVHNDSANIPFRNDDRPAPAEQADDATHKEART
jgi:cytochrome c oxidase cbb3-type subunit 4